MNRTRISIAILVALVALLLARSCDRRPPEAPPPEPEVEACGPRAPADPPREAPPPEVAPDPVAGTTIVVLRSGPSGYALVTYADKPFAWAGPEPATPGTAVARARIEDGAGKVLFETSCAVPRLCRCNQGEDHAQGCAVIRHEAVFRMKVPRLAAREELVLLGGDRELARFDLGRKS